MIKLYANGTEISFTTTKFPDGTSQVWKYSEIPNDKTYFKIDFLWEENESEVLQLFMLIDYIRSSSKGSYIYLNLPYLPYARQDKYIDQSGTYALTSFANLLNSKNIDCIVSFDVHSKRARELIKNFHSISPLEFHNSVIRDYQPDHIFYPDSGAAERYIGYLENTIPFYGTKMRDQYTGEITGYSLRNLSLYPLEGKKVLILDDLVDGGATFCIAATELKKHSAKDIALCVSHGVFSKGKEEMMKCGISKFYTTNSLLKNSEGYKVV